MKWRKNSERLGPDGEGAQDVGEKKWNYFAA
jgi:hypothetical protein